MAASLETSCAHCERTLDIEIDTAYECRVQQAEEGASPLLFSPRIDWEHFTKPHIIDDF